jgi:predicted protein tyrosine phosphatase
MFIENISFLDIGTGRHTTPRPDKSLLIQIVNPAMEFPTPAKTFSRIEQFAFYDVEDNDPLFEEWGFTQADAARMATLLKEAYEGDMDVIVHCVAGICRSGAVVEVATMIGFPDSLFYRNPNATVKTMLMRALNLTPTFE